MIYQEDGFNELVLKLITDKKFRHEKYEMEVEHAEEMSVHLYGEKPEKILERTRPREEDEVKQYRLESWEPFTQSTADKGLTIIAKMFNPTLYSIRWQKESTEINTLKEKTLKKYPIHNSIVNYFSEVALRKMMADPNSIMVVKPKKNPNSQLERVEPMIVIYGSKNVWYKDDDHYLIFRKSEEVNNITVYHFEYIDESQIVYFTAYSADSKNLTMTEIDSYQHNFKEIPAWQLRGTIHTEDDGSLMYKSFFFPAVAFWNKAINHESDLEGAYIQHMHPIRVEASVECDYIMDGQRCKQGYLNNKDGSKVMCPSCAGSGIKNMHNSPFGMIRVNIDQFKTESGGNVPVAPVSFVTVPTEATAMLENRVDKLLERGLYALNMDILNKIGENQSGKAKVIDRGELYDFIYKISSIVFDIHIKNIFKYFNMYLFAVENPTSIENNMPEINKPTQFDISTAQELLADFDVARRAGVNGNYLKVKQKQMNAKEFSTDTSLKMEMDLIIDCDPLPDVPANEVLSQVSQGFITEIDAIIHFNVGMFVKKALLENKGFEEMKPDQRYEIMRGYAEELKTQMKEVINDTGDFNKPY